jgi:hypothetical protein
VTNIAFTTLVILLFAFPGYLAISGYFSGEFTRQVLTPNWTDDIVRGLLFSMPFHLIGIGIFECLQHNGFIHHSLNFEIAFRIMTAEFGNSSNLSHIVNKLYANMGYIIFYYIGVLALASSIGHLFRILVWKWELDVKFPSLFKYRNDAIYRLMGRGQLPVPHNKILVWVDALTDQQTEQPGKNRLYRGIVAGFTTNADGTPRDLILTGARRGKFVQGEQEGEYIFQWEPITPGDYFSLKYRDIKNLNITYYDLGKSPVPYSP